MMLHNFEEAPSRAAQNGYAALTPLILLQFTREDGVDAATALWYDRICRAEPHRAFIEGVEALDPEAALPPTAARLLVAPAAFWREYPQFGADGAAVLAEARALGISAELIPTRSTGSVSENARMIREALAKEEDGSVVLVSLSRGGAPSGRCARSRRNEKTALGETDTRAGTNRVRRAGCPASARQVR